MNRTITTAFLAFIALATIEAAPSSRIAEGLVGYYPFTGDAKNATGNGIDGVMTGVLPSEDRFGKPGQSLSFEGSGSSFVRVRSTPALFSPTQISVSVWVYVESGGSGNPRIFSKGWSVNAVEGAIMRATGPPLNSVRLVNNLGSSGYWVNSKTALKNRQWYMVTFVDDANRESIYIDGTLDNTFVHNRMTVPQTDTDLFFGRNSENASDYFAGRLDDFRIYNRALSDAEVRELYDYERANDPSLFPSLAGSQASNKGFELRFMGQAGREYSIETSTDLLIWSEWKRLLATSTVTALLDSEVAKFQRRFFRAHEIRTVPTIISHPQNQSVQAGGSVSFSVAVTGTPPIGYQWQKDGLSIAGATSDSYAISNVQVSHAGGYSVVVSNPVGSVVSQSAALTVTSTSVAPESIAGKTFRMVITSGTGEFAYTGSYLFVPATTGNGYLIIPLTNDIEPSGGTYTYTKTDGTRATVVADDSGLGRVTAQLTFITEKAGTFVNTVQAVAGRQSGNFVIE